MLKGFLKFTALLSVLNVKAGSIPPGSEDSR